MKKWVESSQEVEIDIGADDVRCALSEAFARVNARDIDDRPNRYDVSYALNALGAFLNGLTDEHILLLPPIVRQTVALFLARHAERFQGIGSQESQGSGPAPSTSTARARSNEKENR